MDLKAVNMQLCLVCSARSRQADQPPQLIQRHLPLTAAGICQDPDPKPK